MEGGGFLVEDDDRMDPGPDLGMGSSEEAGCNDEEAGGGFVQEDDEGSDVAGGGFFQADDGSAEESVEGESGVPALIPLSDVPGLLLAQGLEATPDVLELLRSTSRRTPAARRGARPDSMGQTDPDVGRVVPRSNFEELTTLLLLSRGDDIEVPPARKRPRPSAPSEDNEEVDAISQAVPPLRRRRPQRAAAARQSAASKAAALEAPSESDDDSADAFRSADDESPLSSEAEDVEDTGPSLRRSKGKGKAATVPKGGSRGASGTKASKKAKSAAASNDVDDDDAELHLNPHQRDAVRTAFDLFTGAAAACRPNEIVPSRIGAEELAAIAASLKESLSNAEIEELLTEGARLFAPASHQNATREGAKQAQAAARGLAKSKAGPGGKIRGDGSTIGLDEMGGIMLKAHLI